jgi:ABC-type polysaccharide/polyol phosphate export permease
MKSNTKFKFLHIGLSLWGLIVEAIQRFDGKIKAREQLIDTLVTPNFVKVLVKNISNPKAQLH